MFVNYFHKQFILFIGYIQMVVHLDISLENMLIKGNILEMENILIMVVWFI